jgi:hypothetical protein
MNARVNGFDFAAAGHAPFVAVRRARCGCCLIVDVCPFCRKRHVHGAAAQHHHGHRIAHCRKPPFHGAGYALIEVSTPVTYKQT